MHKLDCDMFDAWGSLQSGSGYALGHGLTIAQKYLLKNHRYKYLTLVVVIVLFGIYGFQTPYLG